MSRIKGRHDTLDLIEISVSMQPSNKDVVALGGQQARRTKELEFDSRRKGRYGAN